MKIEIDERRTGLEPPRFGLGGLMACVSLCALMFAVIHYVGMLGSALALLFLLCALLHVAGNVIGTRLRDIGSQPPLSSDEKKSPRRGFAVSPTDFAPTSRLRERHSLGRRNIIITLAGATLGGLVGSLALLWLTGGIIPLGVIALGACASAVLAGIWTFAAASFVQVMLGAWFHASRGPHSR